MEPHQTMKIFNPTTFFGGPDFWIKIEKWNVALVGCEEINLYVPRALSMKLIANQVRAVQLPFRALCENM